MDVKHVMKFLSGALFLLTAGSANAVLLHHFDHSYDGGSVEIDLDVFDNGGLYSWEYTVTNNSYDPNPGVTNGFSGFELFLPSPIAEIANIVPNPGSSPPWEHNCCSGLPLEWDIRDNVGLGVMPGFSLVFSFTTNPRQVAINNEGWFHSWANGTQVNIVDTIGMHVPLVPGLQPIPEPGTLFLLGLGIAAVGLGRRK
jgi:hypothetical protein